MPAEHRSYGQRCGLALSLDLLGERWTLLILRELDRGPKRFKDLLESLDGISTNLLSERLKTLSQAGVIERVTLAPPASAQAYELAGRGRSLQPILEDLALWGLELMPEVKDSPELTTRAAWAAMTMKACMDRDPSLPPEGTFEFEVGPESFWLRIKGRSSELTDGPAPFRPDAKLVISANDFFSVATGSSGLDESDARITGDAARLEALFTTFRVPSPAPQL